MIALVLLACFAARTEAPPSDAAGMPDGWRSCSADADCVVAPTLAGLDHLPKEGDSCQGDCYLGVHAAHLDTWMDRVAERAAGVPCDREFEECPPPEHYRASCGVMRRCTVEYAPPGR